MKNNEINTNDTMLQMMQMMQAQQTQLTQLTMALLNNQKGMAKQPTNKVLTIKAAKKGMTEEEKTAKAEVRQRAIAKENEVQSMLLEKNGKKVRGLQGWLEYTDREWTWFGKVDSKDMEKYASINLHEKNNKNKEMSNFSKMRNQLHCLTSNRKQMIEEIKKIG